MADLQTIQYAVREIERYADSFVALMGPLSQEQLWSREGNIPNSIGTLARHLTGNLNNYFGGGILKNGYIRERAKEFGATGIAKEQVISELLSAVKLAKQADERIDPAIINQPYSAPGNEAYESLAYHIVRLATHFALHCGQAEYASSFLNNQG